KWIQCDETYWIAFQPYFRRLDFLRAFRPRPNARSDGGGNEAHPRLRREARRRRGGRGGVRVQACRRSLHRKGWVQSRHGELLPPGGRDLGQAAQRELQDADGRDRRRQGAGQTEGNAARLDQISRDDLRFLLAQNPGLDVGADDSGMPAARKRTARAFARVLAERVMRIFIFAAALFLAVMSARAAGDPPRPEVKAAVEKCLAEKEKANKPAEECIGAIADACLEKGEDD